MTGHPVRLCKMLQYLKYKTYLPLQNNLNPKNVVNVREVNFDYADHKKYPFYVPIKIYPHLLKI